MCSVTKFENPKIQNIQLSLGKVSGFDLQYKVDHECLCRLNYS